MVNELAYVEINPIDPRRINRQHVVETILLFGSQAVPSWNLFGTWAKRPLGIDEPHFDLAAVACFAELVPTNLVLAAVLVDRALRRHEREMRSTLGDVQGEWLLGFDGFIGELQ